MKTAAQLRYERRQMLTRVHSPLIEVMFEEIVSQADMTGLWERFEVLVDAYEG